MLQNDLLQRLQTLRNSEAPLQNWLSTLEKRHYHKAGFLLDEVEAYLQTLGEGAELPALFPRWTDANNAHWGSLVALVAFLLCDLLDAPSTTQQWTSTTIAAPTVVTGHLIVEGDLSTQYLPDQVLSLIVVGDLHIKGDYAFEAGALIVLGNMVVEGAFAEKGDYSLTVVGGDLTIGQALNSSGELFVQGKTTCPLVYVSYNHGYCCLNGGFKALFFQESDHGGSFSLGKNEAVWVQIDEMQGVKSQYAVEDYQRLFDLLVPEAFTAFEPTVLEAMDQAEYDTVEEYLEEEEGVEWDEVVWGWLERLGEGKPLFTAVALQNFRQI